MPRCKYITLLSYYPKNTPRKWIRAWVTWPERPAEKSVEVSHRKGGRRAIMHWLRGLSPQWKKLGDQRIGPVT